MEDIGNRKGEIPDIILVSVPCSRRLSLRCVFSCRMASYVSGVQITLMGKIMDIKVNLSNRDQRFNSQGLGFSPRIIQLFDYLSEPYSTLSDLQSTIPKYCIVVFRPFAVKGMKYAPLSILTLLKLNSGVAVPNMFRC